MTATVIEMPPAPASPALSAARHECGILTEVLSMLTQATIRAGQAKRAAEILEYVDRLATEAEARVQALLPTEPGALVERAAEQLASQATAAAVEEIQGGAV